MNSHTDRQSRTAHAGRVIGASERTLITAAVCLVLVGLVVGTAIGVPLNAQTGRPAEQSTHTVKLHNDTDYDGEFEWFVFGVYTDTLTTIGAIGAGAVVTVTLPADIETSYVFYMTLQEGHETGYLDSSVTEARLAELTYDFRFIQDNMSLAAVAPEDWPTEQWTPTPWDISLLPTSTNEPYSATDEP